jgi:hypothetical protein
MAPLISALLCASQVAAWHFDVGAFGHVESRVGRLAITPDAPFSSSADLLLTPGVTLAGNDGLTAFKLQYDPQLLQRLAAGPKSLLTLHNVDASFATADRRGNTLQVSLAGLSGTLDYASATQVLGQQGTLPAFPGGDLLRYANGDLYASLYLRGSRRLDYNINAFVGYTGPGLGGNPTLILRQVRFGTGARVGYLLSRRDSIGFGADVSAVSFEKGPFYTAVAPALGYKRRLSRDSNVELRAGVQATHTQANSAGVGAATTRSGYGWQPVGSAEVSTLLAPARAYTLRGALSAELAPFFDPFRAELMPRAVFQGTLELTTTRKLLAYFRAQWYEPLTWRVASLGPVLDTQEQRLAALSLTASRPLFAHLGAEIGGLVLSRWVTTAELQRSLRSPEFLVYLAITAGFDLWK